MGNHQDSDMKMERFDKMMMAQEKEKTEFTHNDGME